MLLKNVAGQKITVYAWNTATNLPATGEAANITAQISKDGGASAATDDVNPTELDATNHKGKYIFDMAQAETNVDVLDLDPACSTTGIELHAYTIYTHDETKIDAVKAVTDILPRGIKKNVAFTFTFTMVLASDHATLSPGESITATRSLDHAAFAACTNVAAEIGSTGFYWITLEAAEMNADLTSFKATAPGCDDRIIHIPTVS